MNERVHDLQIPDQQIIGNHTAAEPQGERDILLRPTVTPQVSL